jgi:hypothetical protein
MTSTTSPSTSNSSRAPRPELTVDRRESRAAIKAAGIAGTWSLLELGHTFVSLRLHSGRIASIT